jgi:hypothetical protein
MDKSPFEKPGSSRLEEYRPLQSPPAEAGGKEEPARSRLKSKAVHPTTDGPGNTTQSPFHNGNHSTDHAIARKQSDFTSIRNCATPERNLKMSKLQPGATPRDPRPQSFRGPTARIHTSLGQRPGTCAPNPFEGQRPASIPAWGNAPGPAPPILSRANGPYPYQPGAAPQDPRPPPPIQGLKARTIPFPCHPMPIATMNFLCAAAWEDDDRSGFPPSML